MRKLIFLLTNRLTILGIFLLFQLTLFVYIVVEWTATWYYFHLASTILSVFLSVRLIAQDENPMYKMLWVLLMILVPIFGVMFYLFARVERLSMSVSHLMNESQLLRRNELSKVKYAYAPKYIKQQRFLTAQEYPVYQKTNSLFLGSGTEKQKALLNALKQAEKFIFMEYYIITISKMWQDILDILIQKQKEGVEIRIMYDDLGSATKLPYFYHHRLRQYGFKVVRFNPLKLHISFAMNYRDHRKIVVIDNKIAFTGGFNIGDEYTNRKKVFGQWHDAGIMIEGSAVWSYTVLFLENWAFSTKETDIFSDYYIPHQVENDASYIPFGDIPSDNHLTAKGMYMHLINDAKISIYITAPYLILDHEMSTALRLAAESGVDVNIIVPSIPDKRFVYMVSESYISELIKYGVKIHKYTPGFIHSKMIICDESVAMIGSSNLDFRSLYMHLESNLWLNDKKTIDEMVRYMKDTLEKSKLITANALKKRNILYRVLQVILRNFAPLL